MTIRAEDIDRIVEGAGNVVTPGGDKIGKIGEIYTDDESGDPAWVTVKTGLFGTQESFVPISKAEQSGVDLVVPYDKDTVNDAPRIDAGGHITPAEEKRLFAYYLDADRAEGLQERSDLDRDADMPLGDTDRDRDSDSDTETRSGDTDHDRDSDNDTETRSGDTDHDRDSDNDSGTVEPGTSVGTARLRRYVVTEKVIPVSQEEIRVDDPDSK